MWMKESIDNRTVASENRVLKMYVWNLKTIVTSVRIANIFRNIQYSFEIDLLILLQLLKYIYWTHSLIHCVYFEFDHFWPIEHETHSMKNVRYNSNTATKWAIISFILWMKEKKSTNINMDLPIDCGHNTIYYLFYFYLSFLVNHMWYILFVCVCFWFN